MSGMIGEAFVRIRPNMAGFQAETDSGFKKAFASAAKIVGAALATEKVIKFGEDVVKSAANTKRATETIKEGFGVAGDAVTKFNSGTAAQLGISSEAGQTAAARFATLFKTLDVGKSKGAEMTVNLEKMAGGLAQIKGADPSEVLDKLYNGVTGATRGLKSLGIVIDGNTIKQKANELGLVTHVRSTKASETADTLLRIAKARLNDTLSKYGPNTTQAATAQLGLEKAQNAVTKALAGTTSALTPAQKTQAIYAALMDKLAGVQKSAKAHSDDLAVSEKKLQAQWANLKDELGAKLLPVVEAVVGWFAKHLPGAIKTAEDKIQDFVDKIRGPFTGGLDVAKGILQAIATALQATVKFMVQYQNVLLPISGAVGSITLAMEAWTIATEVWATVTKVATAAQKAFDLALDANIIGVIILAIIGLVTALVILYERSNTVRKVINESWTEIEKVSLRVWGAIRTYVLDAFDVIKTVVITDLKVIRDVFNVFKSVFTGDWAGAWRNVKKIFSDIWDGISRVAADVLDVIRHYVEKKALQIGLAIIEPFSHIPRWLGGGWAQDLKANMQSALDDLNQPAAQGGKTVGTMFGQNAIAAANPFLSQLQQNVANALSGGGTFRSATNLAGRPASLTGKSLAGEDPNLTAGLQKLAKAGYDVAVTSAKRTFAQQTALWNRYVKSGYSDKYIAAMPGTSDHERGLAADVLINGRPAASYGAAFLAKYGLTAPLGMRDAVHVTALGGRGQQSGTSGTTTTTPPVVPTALSVGTSSTSAASVAQQIAAAKTSLEASYKKIVASAKDLGGELTGTIRKDMATVRSEITHISSKADVTTAKKNLDDLRTEIADKLKQIRQEIALNNTFDGLKTQVTKLGSEVTPQIKAQMKSIQSEIGKVSTPQQIADLRAQMTRVKNEIAAQLAAIKARVQVEQTSFNAAWSSLASGADAAFQKATNLALKNMQVAVTGAFSSFQFGGSIIQTPAELALAKLQSDHDAAAAAMKLAADQAQLALDLSGAGDATLIVADQAAVDDDLYTAKVAALQAQATLERNAATQQLQDAQTAYSDQRSLLQQQMDQRVADIQTGMLNGSIAAADGMAQLTAVLGDPQYGIDMQNSGLVIGGALYKGLSDGLAPVFALLQKLIDDMKAANLLPPNTAPPIPGIVGGGVQAKPGGKVVDSTGGYYDPSRGIYVPGPGAKTQEQILAELKKQTAQKQTITVNVDGGANSVARMVAR